jgi:hypothetical protein
VRSFVQLSRKSSVAIGLTVALAAVPSAALGTTGASAAARTPAASTQNQNVLTAVAARSSAMAWAVGWWATASAQHSLIERWNGKAWKIVPSPNPAHGVGTDPELEAVAVTSSSNAWAAGFYGAGIDGLEQTLIYHWNGRAWKQVRSPDPGGRKAEDILVAVAASSASSAWAVGMARLKPLIEHWNGKAWQQVASPRLRRGTRGDLTEVAAVSSSDAWTVGVAGRKPLLEHWNGKTWKLVSTPDRFRNVQLSGVTATSASNVWAVGTYEGAGGVGHLLSEHWNGHEWKILPIRNPGGTESEPIFDQVTGASPKDVWAVGSYSIGIQNFPFFEHWNGKAWTQIPVPENGSSFSGVAPVSATSAWVVGSDTAGRVPQTLIEHWNGAAWTQVPSPNR